MDTLTTGEMLLFEDFRLDRGGVSRCDDQGCFVQVPLGSRALEVLGVLVARPGELVTGEEIIKEVWPGTIVEYSNLPVQIAALRRVLDEGRPNGSCIQTVPGRGYRFVAPVTPAEAVTAAPISRSANGAGGPIAADEGPELPSALCPIDGLSPAPKPGAPPRRRHAVIASITAGAVCLAVTVVASMNWHSLSRWTDGPAPRLSIVVLPFANLSNDPDQQYFVDGVTEDLTTDLSRIADSFVISRNTAFTYQNKLVNAKQVGHELGVRYVLEGSVQRPGDRVRVNAQLIDAETDAHLWAERFDRDTGDLFALQNEITSRIGNTLGIELIAAEATRPTERPDALDYILHGRAVGLKPPSRENFAEQISLFEHALALDPQSVEGQSRLAIALAGRVLNGVTDAPAADLARAEGLVGRALAASPRYSFAHHTKATVLRAQNRCEEAIPEYETALALNRNMLYALIGLGWCKVEAGSLDEAIPLAEQAIRLSPRDPGIGWWYAQIGTVHLLQSHTHEAIVWLEQACTAIPAIPCHHSRLSSAYALNGDIERAAAELAEARRLAGDDRYSSIARLTAGGSHGSPKTRALWEATYLVGLRKAGVPEE